MNAYGGDRVQKGEGEQWVISSRFPKNWIARAPATLIKREFPGTAVLWDDQYFEVVSVEGTPQGPARYVLEPWSDRHAIRVSDRYDGERETQRAAEYRAALRREKARKTANVLAVFTGLLPAPVQEQLASEIGIVATRMTLIGFALPIGFVAYVLDRFVRAKMYSEPFPPIWMIILGVYLLGETSSRAFSVVYLNRPAGSVVGLIAYAIAYAAGFRKLGAVSPVAPEPGSGIYVAPAPADIALRDAVQTRAPFMTLLSPAEQQMLARRYGYDYRAHASTVAIIILLAAAAGVIDSAIKLSHDGNPVHLISLFIAAAIAIEQISRLLAFKRGPAGSFLAILARPFVKKLLRG